MEQCLLVAAYSLNTSLKPVVFMIMEQTLKAALKLDALLSVF